MKHELCLCSRFNNWLHRQSVICKACLGLAQNTLPLPLRPPKQDSVDSIPHNHRTQGLKRKTFSVLADEGTETQQRRKKMRLEQKMLKNFRMHLIPLAQSPKVSNVRSIGARPNPQVFAEVPTQNRLAPQEYPHGQPTSTSPNTGSTNSETFHSFEDPFSLQLEPFMLTSNLGYFSASLPPQRSAFVTSDDASTVVSEPYWLGRVWSRVCLYYSDGWDAKNLEVTKETPRQGTYLTSKLSSTIQTCP